MKKSLLTLGISVSLAFLWATAFAEGNADNGKKLFDESRCQKCHGVEVFTKEDRKVTNLDELEKKVRVCDSQLSVNWFDDEVNDVVAYLNRDFYKFEPEQAEEK